MAEDRDLEKVYSRKQFAAKLRRLADSIETEKPFTIQVAGERLKIPAEAEFNVEHERSGDTEELEFQMRWRRAGESPPRTADEDEPLPGGGAGEGLAA